MYFLSLALGATFFILLHTLTRGGWGVAVKRIPEHIMSTLPIFALLVLPLLFGVDHIFEWLHPDVIANDPLIQVKTPYLNLPFFIIRNIIYFGSWAGTLLLEKKSNKIIQITQKKTIKLQVIYKESPLYQFLYYH